MEKTPEQLVREQLEAGTPKAWIWEEDGETCVGTVIGGFVGRTQFGDRKVLTLLVGDEPRSVWLSTTALENQVMQLHPQVGDVLGIKRGEKRQSQSSTRQYWDFVATKYAVTGAALNWGSEPDKPALHAGDDEAVDAEVVDDGSGPQAASNW